jgi:hypothetical protein
MLDFGTGLVSAKVVARNEREARSPSIPHRVIRQPSSANKKRHRRYRFVHRSGDTRRIRRVPRRNTSDVAHASTESIGK